MTFLIFKFSNFQNLQIFKFPNLQIFKLIVFKFFQIFKFFKLIISNLPRVTRHASDLHLVTLSPCDSGTLSLFDFLTFLIFKFFKLIIFKFSNLQIFKLIMLNFQIFKFSNLTHYERPKHRKPLIPLIKNKQLKYKHNNAQPYKILKTVLILRKLPALDLRFLYLFRSSTASPIPPPYSSTSHTSPSLWKRSAEASIVRLRDHRRSFVILLISRKHAVHIIRDRSSLRRPYPHAIDDDPRLRCCLCLLKNPGQNNAGFGSWYLAAVGGRGHPGRVQPGQGPRTAPGPDPSIGPGTPRRPTTWWSRSKRSTERNPIFQHHGRGPFPVEGDETAGHRA